jgi:hypothetical protein
MAAQAARGRMRSRRPTKVLPMQQSPLLVLWLLLLLVVQVSLSSSAARVAAAAASNVAGGGGGSISSASSSSSSSSSTSRRSVSYDGRSILIAGERQLMLSGSIHYARLPPADWDRALKLAKGMGLNTVQTLVMWNHHQPKAGAPPDWTGGRDLARFVRLAQANDLFVVVRIGPYICGEWYYGGIPLWMRDAGAECFRCSDPVWKQHMARFVGEVMGQLRPLLLPAGGPVVMLQIENEYRGADLAYLRWAVDLARNMTTAVPWNLCHDLKSCTTVNNGTSKVLCTINDVWEDVHTPYTQPSPGWLAALRKGNPTQPAIWTEDQAWMDSWGQGQLWRDAGEELYGMARWFAYGGSWHNFYMLAGGNNYGLTAAQNITTAYAPDAPIDNLLLRAPKYAAFAAFLTVLMEPAVRTQLLESQVPPPLQFPAVPGPPPSDPAFPAGAEYHEYGAFKFKAFPAPLDFCCFLCCGRVVSVSVTHLCHKWNTGSLAFLSNYAGQRGDYTNGSNSSRAVAYRGRSFWINNHTVVLVNVTTGAVLFNTSDPLAPQVGLSDAAAITARRVQFGRLEVARVAVGDLARSRRRAPSTTAAASPVEFFAELLGGGARKTHGQRPAEQLGVTENDSDYLWYSTTVMLATSTLVALTAEVGAGTVLYAFIDGRPIPVRDHRSSAIVAAHHSMSMDPATVVAKGVTLKNVSLHILSCAMGMPNVNPSPSDAKGITGSVKLIVNNSSAGQHMTDITDSGGTGWTMASPLVGEAREIFTAAGTDSVPWRPLPPPNALGYLSGDAAVAATWFRFWLDRPELPLSMTHPSEPITSNPSQASFALDLSVMGKGIAYINGFNLGRYWLAPSTSCTDGERAPPLFPGPLVYFRYKACGKPTQHLYHVPTHLLQPKRNLVTLFEETSTVRAVARRVDDVALVLLHDHPHIN